MEQKLQIKLLSFDYFITALICKYYYKRSGAIDIAQIIRESLPTNKLSKLKLMKLLYFVCATRVNNEWYLLDNVFDNFYALPYGPVESTIYDNLTHLNNYTVGSSSVSQRTGTLNLEYELDKKIMNSIDDALNILHEASPALFNLSAFELVELSHKCDSWKIAISEANAFGAMSMKMSNDSIKQSRLYLF